MIRQVKHMGQADSTSIGPTSGADARQGAAGEFGSVECNDVESGRATDTDTTPREAAATPIRVAVVDDHEMFRAGVIATLQPYFHIVGQAADVEGSIAMIADIRPDVVLLDVHVPGGEEEEARRSSPNRSRSPRFRVPGAVGVGFAAGRRLGDSCRRTRIRYQNHHRRRSDLIHQAGARRVCGVLAETGRIRAVRLPGGADGRPAAHGAATRSWTCCQAASRRSCA